MVIFGMVAGFLLAVVLISLAVFAVLPVFHRNTQVENAEHALVIECLENAEELVAASAGGDDEPRPLERGAMSGGRWH